MEQRLETLSRLNSAILSSTTMAIMAFRADGDCILSNQAASRMTGATTEEMSTWNFRQLPAWKECGLLSAAEQALASGQPQIVDFFCRMGLGHGFHADGHFTSFAMDGELILLLVVNDVTHQRQREQLLENSKEQVSNLSRSLDDSNSALQQFVQAASHDLREPLRMISMYMQIIQRRYGQMFDDEAVLFLNYAREGAQRMDRMVLDLLDFSQIGRQQEQPAPVPLMSAAQSALDALSPTISECAATVDITDTLPVIMGYASELACLFRHLLSNAMTYRDEQRPLQVIIGCVAMGTEWVISVSDNGIGIAPEYHERIFGIFQRLHPHDARDGTGIGLAICRKIIDHLGGRMWVESQPSLGSVFRFTIPMDQSKTTYS